MCTGEYKRGFFALGEGFYAFLCLMCCRDFEWTCNRASDKSCLLYCYFHHYTNQRNLFCVASALACSVFDWTNGNTVACDYCVLLLKLGEYDNIVDSVMYAAVRMAQDAPCGKYNRTPLQTPYTLPCSY